MAQKLKAPKHEAKNKATSSSKSSEYWYNVDAKIAYKFKVHEQVGAIVQGSRRMDQKSTTKLRRNIDQLSAKHEPTSANIKKYR